MQILHIDSSILGAGSVSRTVSAAVVERLRAEHPDAAVTHRDLAETAPPHLTLAHLPAADAAPGSAAAESRQVLDEFLAADIVVIGAPMYNFGVPSQLKAWIDRVLVAGETFRYTAEGPVGLAAGKRVILALSRGGFYGPGAPAAAFEHAEGHLRAVFGLMGVTDPEIIVAEGVQVGPEQREAALASALAAARDGRREAIAA